MSVRERPRFRFRLCFPNSSKRNLALTLSSPLWDGDTSGVYSNPPDGSAQGQHLLAAGGFGRLCLLGGGAGAGAGRCGRRRGTSPLEAATAWTPCLCPQTAFCTAGREGCWLVLRAKKMNAIGVSSSADHSA